MAQTWSPASHRIFMAVPPPAPVPTTIASYILAANKIPATSGYSDWRCQNSPAHEGLHVPDRQGEHNLASLATPSEARGNRYSLIQFWSCSNRQPCSPASSGKMRVHSPLSV